MTDSPTHELDVHAAVAALREEFAPIAQRESVQLDMAVGRVLASVGQHYIIALRGGLTRQPLKYLRGERFESFAAQRRDVDADPLGVVEELDGACPRRDDRRHRGERVLCRGKEEERRAFLGKVGKRP